MVCFSVIGEQPAVQRSWPYPVRDKSAARLFDNSRVSPERYSRRTSVGCGRRAETSWTESVPSLDGPAETHDSRSAVRIGISKPRLEKEALVRQSSRDIVRERYPASQQAGTRQAQAAPRPRQDTHQSP